MSDFTNLPDPAARNLGGSVVAANDELFAERENLIRPEAPGHQAATFCHKGQVYDGWETRRRRQPLRRRGPLAPHPPAAVPLPRRRHGPAAAAQASWPRRPGRAWPSAFSTCSPRGHARQLLAGDDALVAARPLADLAALPSRWPPS